jgi:type I restriction enzyme R subunit
MAAGWLPILPYPGTPPLVPNLNLVLTEHPTASGPCDYVLFQAAQPIAIVEAKKRSTGAQNVLKQAQRYAQGLQGSPFDFNGYRVPFVYSTDGDKIWFQDLRDPLSRSREVARFHTPAALREKLTYDAAACAGWLQNRPVDHPLLRPYQRDAITSLEEALLSGQRRMLVAMATGTGKTLTAIAEIYRLMKAGFARRVLFLVDRRALAAQAAIAFSKFEAEPGLKFDRVYEVYSQRFRREDLDEDDTQFNPQILPTSYLTNPNLGDAFVYICTVQRMRINLFGPPGETTGQGDLDNELDARLEDIPIHAFDTIFADECHRGYTFSEDSKWREVLNYFDGAKIGLSATPAAHTLAYFGDMIYRYDYDRAVREGYLVDYDPITVRSEVALHGAFLHPGEEVGLQDRDTGALRYEQLEDERELPASELQQDWTAPDHDRKVVKEVARYLAEQERELGRFPKTLIFAHNDLPHLSHADRLVDLLRNEFGRGDAFVEKITGSPTVDRPLKRIREFRNRPEPKIVVTVDMLSTGVDIPALENIVLLRPIKSRILFEQMLGRGTRLCPEISKAKFTVFDAVGALDYFARVTGFTADPPQATTKPVREVIQAIYDNCDRDYNVRVLTRRLQRIARDVSAEGREQFRRFIPDGDIAAWARDLDEAIDRHWAETMHVLLDPDFQRLLTDYQRTRQPFVVATTTEDYVVSGYLIRTADGRSVRPDDYLADFERFVRENPEHVEAIQVLLERPAGWRTDALRELRDRLAAQPDGFNDERLRRAYKHPLADIISMVKHAASGEPLLSAEERVDRALAIVCTGQAFTVEQERWLALIRDHLIENLAIDRDDFGLLTFTRAGATWGRVNHDFDGRLADMLAEVNAAMAK